MQTISSRESRESLEAEARQAHDLIVSLTRRHSLRDPIGASCDKVHLTHPQIHTLLYLGHDGAQTMGELARRIGVTEKTFTGIADRLEREGYLRRLRTTDDRRVVHVELTRKGVEAHHRIETEIHGHIADFMVLLDPADRKHIFRILRKLYDRMNEKAGGSDKRPSERRL
jgi:DNA-binding MarR family transcriptional regulator